MINLAVQAAVDAGERILEIYREGFDVTYKDDQSPLTTADQAGHDMIMDRLAGSSLPVLSEESRAVPYQDRGKWEEYWLVDPLDGTKEFVNRNGEFTVNIALIEAGTPVVGVVYVPVEDVLYLGVLKRGLGAPAGAWKTTGCRGKSFKEQMEAAEPCRVSGRVNGPLRIVASKSHFNDGTRNFIADLEKTYGPPEFVSRGSSLKLCMVAEGSADFYPRIAPTMEWDTAAAHAVVTAAGGAVYRYDESVPAEAYLVGGKYSELLTYNKEDLLNPFFVVSGLLEQHEGR